MRIWEIGETQSSRRRPFDTEHPQEPARIHDVRKLFRRRENAKALMAGSALFVILCLMSAFLQYSNHRIDELRKVTERGQARLVKFEEDQRRTKRSLDEVRHWAKAERHSIAKRSALPLLVPEEEPEALYTTRGGSVYTRWGRRDCPGHAPSSLIYHGIGAGSHYSHTGGGADYICLHSNITYEPGRYRDGNNGASYVYGMEFRDSSWLNHLFDLQETMQASFQYHSVPCALCMANGRFGQVMIAGKTSCPDEWTYEYDGYIMTGAHGDKHSSEYICVDRHIQVVPGTQGSQDGSRLHIVETQCTSLLCEPVVVGREITCVVCTI